MHLISCESKKNLPYVSDVRDYGVDFRVRLIKLLICDSTKVQASLVTVKENKEIKNEVKNLDKILRRNKN